MDKINIKYVLVSFVLGILLIIGICVLLFISSGAYQLDSATPISSSSSSSGINPSPDRNEDVDTATVKIYLVALGDGGKIGDEIGCGDSIVSVERIITNVDKELDVALKQLLLVTNRDPSSGLYNSLQFSDLVLEGTEIDNGIATVSLTGEFQTGGACDNPRIEEQLKRTALQFPEINDVEIFINDQRLEDLLSSR